MDQALYITLLCFFVSFVYLCLHLLLYKNQSRTLPPGKTGWPVIGETWEFIQTGWKGQPEKFVMDRLTKYSAPVFKTNLVLEPMAVFCGAEGNKFLFANENKVVRGWYPACVDRILLASTDTSMPQEMFELREALPKFLNPQSLASYIGIMDEIAQKNLSEGCANKEQVLTYPLVKQFTFALACRLFLSIQDEGQIDELVKPFYTLVAGLFSIPINFPGSPMNKAIKASKHITRKIHAIMKQRKMDLAEGKVSPSQDILLHMLDAIMNDDESRKLMREESIAAKIMGMLIAGHDTASIALTFIVKYLAEYPEIYDAVYKEQMEIAKAKAPGELLTWKDLQQMKYSWNVACEALRLTPPSHGAFREALVDFTYKGFSIPKGWKLYWSVHSTHKNPEVFPEPEKFDPTRFEGSGPAPYTFVPFGGGKRMCPGKEYARLEILVYMHNLVKRFKWEKIIPKEAVVVNPMPVPAKGLPIRLFPHKA